MIKLTELNLFLRSPSSSGTRAILQVSWAQVRHGPFLTKNFQALKSKGSFYGFSVEIARKQFSTKTVIQMHLVNAIFLKNLLVLMSSLFFTQPVLFFRHFFKKQTILFHKTCLSALFYKVSKSLRFFIYIILLTNNNKNLLIFHMYLAPSKSL